MLMTSEVMIILVTALAKVKFENAFRISDNCD